MLLPFISKSVLSLVSETSIACPSVFFCLKDVLNIQVSGQAEIETHVKPGSLSLYVHYGQSRPKDAKVLTQSNVVITTYGVLASEFCAEVILLFRFD